MPRSKVDDILHYFEEIETQFSNYLTFTSRCYFSKLLCGGQKPTLFCPLVDLIFLHWEDLMKCHTSFRTSATYVIRDKSLEPPARAHGLAKCFFNYKGNFQVFLRYAKNLPRALHLLEELRETEDSFNDQMIAVELSARKLAAAHNYPMWKLEDLLNAPILKIYRYPIFIRDLSRYAKTKEMLKDFQSSLEAIEDISECVQNILLDSEEMRRIEQIQNRIYNLPDHFGEDSWDQVMQVGFPRRNLIDYGHLHMHGEVQMTEMGSMVPKNRYLILMDYILILCSPRERKEGEEATYHFEAAYHGKDLHELNIEPSEDTDLTTFTLTIGSELVQLRTFCCRVRTEQLVNKWLAAMLKMGGEVPAEGINGHHAQVHPFPELARCDVCGRLFRGMFFQGYKCLCWGTKLTHVKGTSRPKEINGRTHYSGCHTNFHLACLRHHSKPCPQNKTTAPVSVQQGAKEDRKWFADEMSAEHAEQILKACPEGTFLVRKSNTEKEKGELWVSFGYYHLHLKGPKDTFITVHHYPIHLSALGQFTLRREDLKTQRFFNTVDDLVVYITITAGSLIKEYVGCLLAPYKDAMREVRRVRGGLYFDWLTPIIRDELLLEFGLISLHPRK